MSTINSWARNRIFSTTWAGALDKNSTFPQLAVYIRFFLLGTRQFLGKPLALGLDSIFFSYTTRTSNRAVLRAPGSLASEASTNVTFRLRPAAPLRFGFGSTSVRISALA